MYFTGLNISMINKKGKPYSTDRRHLFYSSQMVKVEDIHLPPKLI